MFEIIEKTWLCRPALIEIIGSPTMPPSTKAIQIETLIRPAASAPLLVSFSFTSAGTQHALLGRFVFSHRFLPSLRNEETREPITATQNSATKFSEQLENWKFRLLR